MFAAFNQLEDGAPIHLRANRVIAVAETPDGARVFLAGGMTCLVTQSAAEVIAALAPAPEQTEN